MDRYSIWILPTSETYKELQAIIMNLSSVLFSPLFAPHVTILAELDGPLSRVVAITEQLASSFVRFDISSGPLHFGSSFFTAAYLPIHVNATLRELHEKASQLAAVNLRNSYLPHLSLAYGNLTPEQKRLPHFTSLRRYRITFPAIVLSVYVAASDIDTERWTQVAEYKLGGNK